MSEQITITITNGFERGILAYDAANGVDVRRGPATYHDDEVSSVEIPQDGKSVAGRTAYSGEERLFWPVELTTSEQVRNALALCKRHNAVLCPYHGKVSDEARAALHDIGRTQVSHDGFNRTCLIRETVSGPGECAECGQPARFRYAIQRDDNNRKLVFGPGPKFCSANCFRSYHS